MKAKLIQVKNNQLLFEVKEVINDKIVINKDYEITKFVRNRSKEQNRRMWGIIQAISEETGQNAWSLYLQGLEKTGVVVNYILGLPQIEGVLRRIYRIVEIVETREQKGVKLYMYKCYLGSSKMNTIEMNELTDYFIEIATDLGLEIILESED